MKTCTKCKVSLSLECFSKCSRNSDGKLERCKNCYNAYMREFYQRDPKKIQERAAKYFEQNRQAQNLNRKIHYNNNVEKHLANSKKWAADNPIRIRVMKAANRAKRKNAPRFQVSHKEVERLLNQQCFYCRVAHSKQIDHIVPLVRGGSHSIGNLIGACARCNQSKNAKTIMEWRLDKMRSI